LLAVGVNQGSVSIQGYLKVVRLSGKDGAARIPFELGPATFK